MAWRQPFCVGHIRLRIMAAVLASSLCTGPLAAQTTTSSIEKLLQDGWEIAGYVAAFESRTLILFKHPTHTYLIQCSVLTDVLRNPRIVTVCYELR